MYNFGYRTNSKTMIKKFFNLAEAGSGGAEQTVTESIDFANGFESVEDSQRADLNATTIENTVEKEEALTEKEKVEEKEVTTQKNDEAKVEKVEETKADSQATKVGWEDAIKGVDKKELIAKLGDKREILEALGVSKFVIDLNEHYDRTGNADDYLQMMGIDYDKLGDDEVILDGIRRENPKAPESVVQKLYKKELEKYETDPEQFDKESVELGTYLKKVAADKFRESAKENQSKFIIPKTDPKKDDSKEVGRQAEAEKINKSIVESSSSQSLLSEKILKLGGENEYKYEVKNPQDFVDYATGKSNFFSLFANEDGSLDIDKFYATVALATDRKGYEKSLIEHGKSLVRKEQLEEEGNAGIRNETAGSEVKKSDWEELESANNGRYN